MYNVICMMFILGAGSARVGVSAAEKVRMQCVLMYYIISKTQFIILIKYYIPILIPILLQAPNNWKTQKK